jgi:sugar phosphate isomerase/epimerase
MTNFSRRQFLNTTLGAAGLAAITSFDLKKYKPLLAFSTLGCPDWPLEKILDFAAANGYNGIEIRGILRQMDLPKCPEFSKENIQTSLQKFRKKKLKIVNLGCSAAMHHSDPVQRNKSMEEAKNFIQLAHELGCPYIRVFPNNLPKDKDKNETLDLISKGLLELGEFAKNTNVMVLMETHGEVVWTADLEQVMTRANHPKVGLVWDFTNMWTITKESPELMYEKLKKFIYHTHIKDAKLVNGKLQYVLLGQGETPILKAVEILVKNKYSGYYSFEWEKMWHPEIESPEIAFPHYPKAIKNFLDESKSNKYSGYRG